MVYSYYHRLNRPQQAVYRKSDAIDRIQLNHPEIIRRSVISLNDILVKEDRNLTEQAVQAVIDAVTSDLKVGKARARVLSARPSHNWGELHGLYEPAGGAAARRITVWMRTAKHKKVVGTA